MQDRYHGWTNYETWLVKVWIDNSLNGHIHCPKQDSVMRNTALNMESISTVADSLKNLFENAANQWMPDDVGELSDMLRTAINEGWFDVSSFLNSEINWYEIASSLTGTSYTPNNINGG
jgi:hypothetical protein